MTPGSYGWRSPGEVGEYACERPSHCRADRSTMPARFQLVIDCKDTELPARFWAAALGYVLEPPPEGFATWDDWRRDIGLPDSELGIGADSIIDPRGDGPRIWFHVMPDAKVVKNRLHLDIHVSGSRSDPLVPACSESTPRPGG